MSDNSNKAPKGIDWDAQPLGKMPDTELAEKIGCSAASVYMARTKRDIPSYRKNRPVVVEDTPPTKGFVSGFRFSQHAFDRYRQKFPGRCSGMNPAALAAHMDAELTKARDMGELIRDDQMRYEINKWNQAKKGNKGGPVPNVHFYGVDDAPVDSTAAFNDISLTRRILNHRPIYVVDNDHGFVITVLKLQEFMTSINYGLNVLTAPKEEAAPSTPTDVLQHRPLAALASIPVPVPVPSAPAITLGSDKNTLPAPTPEQEPDAEFCPLPPELLGDVETVATNSGVSRGEVLELLVRRGLADLKKRHPQMFTPMKSLLEQWGSEA